MWCDFNSRFWLLIKSSFDVYVYLCSHCSNISFFSHPAIQPKRQMNWMNKIRISLWCGMVWCGLLSFFFYRFNFAIVTAREIPFNSMNGNKINRTLNVLIVRVCVQFALCICHFPHLHAFSTVVSPLEIQPKTQVQAGRQVGFLPMHNRYCIRSWVAVFFSTFSFARVLSLSIYGCVHKCDLHHVVHFVILCHFHSNNNSFHLMCAISSVFHSFI